MREVAVEYNETLQNTELYVTFVAHGYMVG